MKIISGLVLLLAINLMFGGLYFSGINYADASSHEVILGGTSGDEDALMYLIDPLTGTPTEFLGVLLDEFGNPTGLSSIDMNSSGEIYSGGNDFAEEIRQIFLTPNDVLGVIVPGFENLEQGCNDVSFAPDGTFYCYHKKKGGLQIVDLDAGTRTLVGLGNPDARDIEGNGLAVSPDGTIYHGTDVGLNVLSPTTGLPLPSLPWQFPPELFGQDCRANAMDFSSEEVLFAHMFCEDNFDTFNLVTIDPATAQVTFVGETVTSLEAITFIPVPEPQVPGAIHGMKWNDANTNGILDVTEQGVQGVEICLFLNDGFRGDDESPQEVAFEDIFGIQFAEANIGPIGNFEEIACTVTDENGEYWFENLFPGFYIVEEFLIDQIQIYPDRDYVDEFGECPFFTESCLELLDFFHPENGNPSIPHFIEVANGESVENVNFGNIQSGFLHGMKWNDANENGIKDVDEVGVPGVKILLFKLTPPDTQGELVSSTFTMFDDPATPDNEDGMYWFAVEPGTYRIEEVLPTGSFQTFPASSAPHYVDVASGETVPELDFGNTNSLPGSIHGMKFSDTNRNGIHDSGEPGVPNVTFCLSSSGTCTLTDGDGEFWFENLSPGEYVVSETVPSNSVNTTPIVLSTTVISGQDTLISFGNTTPIFPPTEVTVSPLNTWGSGGLPSVYWQNNITISKDTGPTGFDHCGDASPISVDLQLDFTQSATVELIPMELVVGPGDVYSATLAPFFPLHGLLNLTFLVECPSGPEIQVGGSIYIDPSGQITDVCTDLPIEGVQVTLLKEYPPTGEFFIAEETDYIEDTGSVQTTGADGRYAWNTVAGNYKVSASAVGFITQDSPIVPIPPPVLDLDVALERVNGCTTDSVTIDHYLAYDVKETKHTEKFEKITVILSDQFETDKTYTVEKPHHLYNPVQKTHDGTITEISDEISHLLGYKIKEQKGEKFDKVDNVSITNQFGDITVDVKKPKLLLVPSAKDHFTTPDELDSITINHFKCYDVKESKGTPKFEKQTVTVYDPNFEITKDFEVKKPKHLCTPVDKNDEGISDAENHLMCYDLKKMKGESKFEKQNVFTNNQFGSDDLEVKKQHQLCVPSINTTDDGLPDDESGGL